MSRIVWDKTGERFYETGVDRAVLYPISSAGLYNKGVPWNGITGITESLPARSPTTSMPTTSSTWCWWALRTSA